MRVELRDGDGMEVAQITTDAGGGLAQLIGPAESPSPPRLLSGATAR